MAGETIIIENPKHWKNYILPAVAMAACLAGMALRLAFPDASLVNHTNPGLIPDSLVMGISYIEAVTLAILTFAVGLTMIETAFTRYYITTRRVVAVNGWINVRMSDMLIERVETISLSQRWQERIFDSGDILCVSAGASIYLDDVYEARKFRQTVIEKMSELENNQ